MKKILSYFVVSVMLLSSLFVFGGCGEKKISKIEVDTSKVKLEYDLGQEIDLDGLVVKIIYEDETEEVLSDYELDVSAYNTEVVGEYTISVTYEEYSATFVVYVKNIGSVSVVSNGTYYIGQTFESAMPVVCHTSSSGIQTIITDYTVSGFDSATSGEKEITISYCGLDYLCTINVLEDIEYFDYVFNNLNTAKESVAISNLKGRLLDRDIYHSETLLYNKIEGSSYTRDIWVDEFGVAYKVITYQDGSETEYIKNVYSDKLTAIKGENLLTFKVAPKELYDEVIERFYGYINGVMNDTGEYGLENIEFSILDGVLTLTLDLLDGETDEKLSDDICKIDLSKNVLMSYESYSEYYVEAMTFNADCPPMPTDVEWEINNIE